MCKRNIKKVIIVLAIFISITAFFSNFTFAFDPATWKPGDMGNATKFKNVGNSVIGLLQIVGSFISIAVLIILGIKYMAGSAEEKAEYKKTLLPYLIGAIMVFGITNILPLVQEIAKMFD